MFVDCSVMAVSLGLALKNPKPEEYTEITPTEIYKKNALIYVVYIQN